MRKTIDITIAASGRDAGKVFRLTELPATQAEKWAMRAFLALAKAGIEVPDDVRNMGLAGLATLSLKNLGSVAWDQAEPLLDEMFACINRVPDPAQLKVARFLVEDDIEEVATRIKLRAEVLDLHTGFSSVVANWKSALAAAGLTGANASPNTETFPQSSAQS